MRRRQFVELEDLPWCPRAVRDGGTDWLAFVAGMTRVFDEAATPIRNAMLATQTTSILDLCSGGGGPWPSLSRKLAESGPVRIELSDRYPNVEAFERLRTASGGRVRFRTESIDATDVPSELAGVRTIFNAFHHFPPAAARAILSDAVRKRRAIVIVEGTGHRGAGFLGMALQIPALALGTPFVKPFRVSRLVLTYLLPLIPFMVLWDGTVSFLRLYLEDELRELIAGVPDHESFDWNIETRGPGGKMGVLVLTGVPRDSVLGRTTRSAEQ